MVNVTKKMVCGIEYTNITLTRGDDCTLVLPIYIVDESGNKTEYTPTMSDIFNLTVRVAPVKTSGSTPAVVFNGSTSISSGKLEWNISSSDSTQDEGTYYWDVQITQNNKVYTFYQGQLIITPEVTVA